MIHELTELRKKGVPGTAEVLRYQAGGGEDYRDAEQEVWFISVNEYTNHDPDVVIA